MVGVVVVAGRLVVGAVDVVLVGCEVVGVSGVVVGSLPPPAQVGRKVATTRRDKRTMVKRKGIETQIVFFIKEPLLLKLAT